MGEVVLRHQQQARGVLVDAVDDAGSDLAADAGQVVQMREQRVHQRAGLVARRGMHHHTRGLEHHRQVVVLVEYVQCDVLGLQRHRSCRGQRHPNGHARLQPEAGLGLGRAVHGHAALSDQRPGPGTGDTGQRRGEHIQPLAVLIRGHQRRIFAAIFHALYPL